MEDSSAEVIDLLKRVFPFRQMAEGEDEEAETEGEANLAWIAGLGMVVSFKEGETLYNQGDSAEYFHIILDGDVNLNYFTGKINASMGVFENGDMFGVEVIEKKPVYCTDALATSQGRLFRITRQDFLALLEKFPQFVLPFQMLVHSLHLSLEVYLDWRDPKETIFYIDRRHPFFLLTRMIIPAVLFVAGVIVLTSFALVGEPGSLLPGFISAGVAAIGGALIIWNYVDWTNDYSIITNRRAIFQEKVVLLYDSRQESPMEAVLASGIESSQVGRIVGYGDLILKTYTGTLAFPDLRHPEVVKGFLDDRRQQRSSLHEEEEHGKMRKELRQRLDFWEEEKRKKKVKKQVKSGSLAEALANIFRMRWEQNNVITYRKHWFILMQKIFFPSLILLAWVVIVFLGAAGLFTLLSPPTMLGLGFVVFLMLAMWWWYQYADWANDVYIVSDDTIVDVYKKPLGSEEKREAPVRNIQSVEFERLGILGLVLNYGTVYIRIGDTRFTFDTVYAPSEVQRELFSRIERHNFRVQQREADAARKRMLDAIEAYHAVMGDPYGKTESGDIRPPGPKPQT